MKNLIKQIARMLMSIEDTVCLQRDRLLTEAYQQYNACKLTLRKTSEGIRLFRCPVKELQRGA